MYRIKKHIGIRFFLLVLFLGYFTDIHFFTHSHIINGVTIVHSHFTWPSEKKDLPAKHTHSGKALELMSQVSDGTALVAQCPVIPEILPLCRDYAWRTDYFSFISPVWTHFYRRGPPEHD